MQQSPKWGRQVILALVLCALSAIAYWAEVKHKPAEQLAEEKAKKLFTLKDKQISEVRLFDGTKSFAWDCQSLDKKLCKAGDNAKWEMVDPFHAKADDTNVNSLVSSLNNLNISDTIDLKDETPEKRAFLLKQYGLTPEMLMTAAVKRLEVKAEDGETVVYFGATHPIGDGIFVVVEKTVAGQPPTGKPDESKVFLAPSYFKSNFTKDLTYWRDKKVMNINLADVVGFKFHSKENSYSAEKAGSDWILHTSQGPVPGDIENVDNLLSALSYLTATDFASDDKKDAKAKTALAGAKPIISLELSLNKDPKTENLTVYEKTVPKKPTPVTTLYATVSDLSPLFVVAPGVRNQLNKSVSSLRLAKLITAVERFSAKTLEFSGTPIGTPPLVLTNISGKWTTDAGKTEVSGDKIQTLLDKLSGNRIKEFLTKTIPAGEAQGLKLTLGDEKNPAKRVFVFWKKDGKLYARDLKSRGAQEAFLIDPAVQEGLPWNRAFFSKKGTP